MKKFIFTLIALLSMSTYVFAGVTVELNGETLNFTDANGYTVNPQIINNRTMVPLRKIFETLGAEIEWFGDTETVIATKGDTKVKLQINNPIAELTKDGVTQKITLDSKPVIVNDRTLVPLRFISESLEKQVAWDQDTQTSIIIDYDYFINVFKTKAPVFYNSLVKKSSAQPATLKISKAYYDLKNAAYNNVSNVTAQIYNNSENSKKVIVSMDGNSELFNEIRNEGWSNFDITINTNEKGVSCTSTSATINQMIGTGYKSNDELNLIGSVKDSWGTFFKNIFGKEEKDVNLATFYNINSDYTKFINLFKFSNTANSSTITASGINYLNATLKSFDYTKFDNVLLENEIVQVYNILNKLIFNYDVTMDELLYNASNINISITTTVEGNLYRTNFIVELLNEYNEKVVYTVNVTR